MASQTKHQFQTLLSQIYNLTPTRETGRWTSMEGMRGLAVFLVFLVHYHGVIVLDLLTPSLSFQILTVLWGIGHAGVDLFFVLSGYLIYGTVMQQHDRPGSLRRFYARRAQRLYPPFLAVFGLYVLLSFVFPEESKIPETSLSEIALYLFQNLLFLPGLFDITPIITVSWSLSYEAFFYVCLPMLASVFRLRSGSAVFRLSFWSALMIGFTVFCFIEDGSRVRLLMFGSGIVLYEFVQTCQLNTRLKRDYSSAAICLFVIGLTVFHLTTHPNETGGVDEGAVRSGVFGVLAIFVAFNFFVLIGLGESCLNQWLSWQPLRALGNMSYSYYLIHGLTLKGIGYLGVHYFPPGAISAVTVWLFLPLCFAVTWLTGTLLFVSVEKPLSLSRKIIA